MTNSKARVFTLGETLLDIIFENDQPVKAIPGGSMLNASVSLSRVGMDVEIITELCGDVMGDIIRHFLVQNHISYSGSVIHPGNKTSLAIAVLDEYKNAAYSFYHDYPDSFAGYPSIDFNPGDILLFGSFYSIRPDRRSIILEILRTARQSGALLIYDPNIRQNHFSKHENIREAVLENMKLAHIVKGSEDDFINIFGESYRSFVNDNIRAFCEYLIITAGKDKVSYFTPLFNGKIPVPSIHPVSTIGAGDNFNAGIIYGMHRSVVDLTNIETISEETWKAILSAGIAFANATCLSIENYVPENFSVSGIEN